MKQIILIKFLFINLLFLCLLQAKAELSVGINPVASIMEEPLNGTYTIGIGGNYATLTAAIADYNSKPLSGPVVLSLLDTNYPNETFPIVINGNLNASVTNTLTIQPASGVTANIIGSNATTIFKLNGADYVTINGSNNESTSRDLTITNTNAGGVILWIASVDASNGSLNSTISNVKLVGNSPTTTVAGIVVSGSVVGVAAESSNTGFKAVNNSFNKMQNGIFAIGNATTPDQGFRIINNIFGSTATVDKLGFRGLAVQNAEDFGISGNEIIGVTTNTTSTSSGVLIGGIARNGKVFNNKISDIKNTNTTGYGSNGVFLNSNSNSANIIVYNNFISNVASYGYSAGGAVGDNGYGIAVNQGSGYHIYYNTVVMNTNQTVSGRPAAINITSTVTANGAINLKNNIFVNTQTQAGERYAIYSEAPSTVFASIDYNNYYTTGTNLGYIGGNKAGLADIKTAFGGNTNSQNVAPVFVSASDLHLVTESNQYLSNTGTPIADITTDIDGDIRNITRPDIGADEFDGPSVLPVRFLSFSVDKKTDYVALKWKVSHEVNSDKYIIYRAGDDGVFTALIEIKSSGKDIYTYKDANPLNGRNYYKLIQVDSDNTITELAKKFVTFDLQGTSVIAYPNPTDRYVHLKFTTGKYDKLEICNLNGKKLQTVELSSTNVSIDLEAYNPGVYLLKLYGNGTSEIVKIIKR